jgi:hypothetical protein
VDYKAPKRALVDGAVWFALLGMGLRADAVRRHYPSKTLAPPEPGPAPPASQTVR